MSWRERVAVWWGQFYLCGLLRQHHVTMNSHGCCDRCGQQAY